jgi:la-related protein 1
MASKDKDVGTEPASSSSSYANVVTNLKELQPPAAKPADDNNKENIAKAVEPPACKPQATEVAAAKTVEPVAETPPPDEDIDDSSFTPVVSHNKRERKQQKDRLQGKQAANREQRPPKGNGEPGNKAKRRSKDQREPRTRGEREKGGEVVEPSDGKTSSKEQDSDEKDNDSDGKAEKKKFVEAPPPKENAWKVRMIKL